MEYLNRDELVRLFKVARQHNPLHHTGERPYGRQFLSRWANWGYRSNTCFEFFIA
jgi:hypothetical protein